MEQKLISGEGGFRTEEVDNATVIGMELAVTEEGVLRAVLAVDDEKGLLSYRIGNLADFAAQLVNPNFVIPGFGMSTDFNKLNKALGQMGYESYWDVEAKTWRTEPALVGKKITIKSVKTGSGKNKAGEPVDYHSLIDIVNIGGAGAIGTPAQPGTPKPSAPTAAPKGATPEIIAQGIEIFSKLLTKPMTAIELQSAMIKAYPDEATGANKALRTSMASNRPAILAAMIADGIAQATMDTPPKYSLVPV